MSADNRNYNLTGIFLLQRQTNYKPLKIFKMATLKNKTKKITKLTSDEFQLLYKKFMEESKTETFNENEFKIYQALKTLGKEGLTDFEKAKIINDIINPKN